MGEQSSGVDIHRLQVLRAQVVRCEQVVMRMMLLLSDRQVVQASRQANSLPGGIPRGAHFISDSEGVRRTASALHDLEAKGGSLVSPAVAYGAIKASKSNQDQLGQLFKKCKVACALAHKLKSGCCMAAMFHLHATHKQRQN